MGNQTPIYYLLCLSCAIAGCVFAGCTVNKTADGSIVDCKNLRLTEFPKLPYDTVIADLHGNNFYRLRKEHLSGLVNLKKLIIHNSGIKEVDGDAFSGLTRLDILLLDSNGLSYLPPKTLWPLKNVVELDLSCNSGLLGKRPRSDTFHGLYRLRKLSLKGTGIESLPDDIFETNQNVTSIKISDNRLRTIPVAPANLPFLEALDLSGNRIRSLKLNVTFKTETKSLTLRLLKNSISELNRQDVMALKNISNLVLRLRKNNLTKIAENTFNDFKEVSLLDVSENPLCKLNEENPNECLLQANLQNECEGLYNLTKALQFTKVSSLVLQRIGWKSCLLSGEKFLMLRNSSLRNLNLGENNFGRIKEDAFRHIWGLNSLGLESCAIDDIPPSALAPLRTWLRTLYLSNNNLRTFMLPQILSECPHLSFIDLSRNNFRHTVSKTYVIGDHVRIRIIKLSHSSLNVKLRFDNLTALERLDLNTINPSPNSFKLMHLQLRNLPSLRTLKFRDNRGYLTYVHGCRLEHNCYSIFKEVKALEMLDISNNDLYRSPPDLLLAMFESLTNLKELNMPSTVDELYPGMFDSMQKLVYLSLSNNKLKTIPNNIFRNLKKLEKLKLDNNDINVLQKGIFEGLNSLTYVNIATIKLVCDCQLRPLQNWIREHKTITVQGGEQYCFAPASTTNMMINEYSPSWFECDNNLVILVASSSGCLFFVIGVSLLLFALRWDIKFAIAVRRARRYLRNHQRRDKTFDAFVSYSTQDTDWIKRELIPKVEEDQDFDFHLCIHERDFIVGTSIVENLEENIEKSKKVIFLVTDSFMTSGDCDLEINLTKTKWFDRCIDSVIFVCFMKVKKSKIPEPMSTMMRHSRILYWPEEGRLRERNVFWKQLKLALWSRPNEIEEETLL